MPKPDRNAYPPGDAGTREYEAAETAYRNALRSAGDPSMVAARQGAQAATTEANRNYSPGVHRDTGAVGGQGVTDDPELSDFLPEGAGIAEKVKAQALMKQILADPAKLEAFRATKRKKRTDAAAAMSVAGNRARMAE